MPKRFRPAVLLLASLALVSLLAGCPKRPMTAVSAPAPAAPASPSPAPAPAPRPVAPAPAPDYMANAALQDVFFGFDKSAIRPGDHKILDASVTWLKANPNQLVLIEGYCDVRGTSEYNLALGERRARAAMNYLVSHGVTADRIKVASYGKEREVCAENTEACRAKNRHAHFLTKSR
jgi:peptidoglycan-associated lipoprotein